MHNIFILILMIVSAIGGYQFSNFNLEDLINKKVAEEIVKSRLALNEANKKHDKKVEEIVEDYETQKEGYYEKWNSENLLLKELLANNDEKIAGLRDSILKLNKKSNKLESDIKGFNLIEGAHNRDDEIKKLKKEIDSLKSELLIRICANVKTVASLGGKSE